MKITTKNWKSVNVKVGLLHGRPAACVVRVAEHFKKLKLANSTVYLL